MCKSSFDAIIQADCRMLILGSLPGDVSLHAGHYYAHPRNAFWPIMSKLLQLDLCAMPFELRYSALQANGIGLWDVVAQAQRKGSLDTAISQATINPLAQRCAALTQLKLIAFNGKTAAKLGSKQIPKYINQVVLPSSSPAHTLKIEQKFSDWQSALSPHLAT
ncbi:DNA-deoxyinosine glycosylase [Deefgea tanakiae]|uniref:DNA-deoxyinosine glycosylase n=1 Tax=Deefgea tanakiae TaxID=2865840 RepID=A0ABX8Z9X5_9NEIS|nr:DNA-deoxyinosine glycosylase [Deefgea tanakiae]QZA79362.1 DNA-deoxyinosine glycosylase [Deefgea tanakiae]